jgi:probable HAF family extracellular repeat protein
VAVLSERESAQAQEAPTEGSGYSIRDLGTLPGGDHSQASGINNRGQVVGLSTTASGEFHAFLWEKGEMTNLGTLPGRDYSQASGINNRGQVVGSSSLTSPQEEGNAFLWEDGEMTDLGTLGGNFSQAFGINSRGQVVGWSTTASGYDHAVLWNTAR